MNGQKPTTNYHDLIRAHQLSIDLNDIMMLIHASHDVDEILRKVVEGSSKALGCDSARIAMREGDKWVIRYVSNLSDDLIGRSFTDEELPHAALAVTTRKPVAIEDAFHDDRTNTGMMKSLGIKSVLVLPLSEKDAVIGTLLYGYHSKAVSFTDADIDFAERMVTGVAIALQDARLYQDLEESKRLGDALNEIDTILFSTKDADVIMNRMLQLSTEAIGAETGVIFSREGDRWTVRYEYKLPVSLVGQNFSNTEVMHTAITAITKRSLVVQDALNDPDINQKFVEMLGIRSLLDFPMIVKGEVIGDLTFHHHSGPVPFNERQFEFVRKLQISISLALENDRLLDTSRQSEFKLKEAERLGQDVTDQRRAEEERDWVFDYSLDMLCVCGFDGYLKRVSPSFEKTLGWSEAELLSRPLFDFIHPDDLEMSRQTANAHEEGREAIHFENRCLCKDGSYKWLSWNSHPMVKEKLIIGVARDITDHKRATEALRHSEERFRTLFNSMIEGFCIVEVLFDAQDRPIDYRFEEVNAAFESQTGMHDVIGKLMSELAPEHEVHWFEVYGKVSLTGESARFENRAEALNRWFDVSAYQVEGRDSHRVAIFFNDITEAKRAEAEVQDAREYAENIVETVIEPLMVLNSDLKILTANHSFYDTFKVTPEETIGNFIYDLGNRQWDIPKLRVLFEEILPQDTVFNGYEVEHDFLDIGRKIIMLNARQIFRENIGSHIILLAMEDITERKQLTVEVQDAREYAENIVETVREPLVVLNSELKILTANQSFYRTFKVTPEETMGNFIYDLGNRQWDIPKLRVLFEEILPNDTVFNDYEVEHDFLDIGHKVILLNARQIFRENIGSNIILLAMEDFTERKYAEEEIKRLNMSLTDRAEELQAANNDLETFNYTVAHDLRQPLSLMSMYCQSIKLLCGDQLKEECLGYVQDAYQATLRMDGLIGALLNFSRMGRVEPQRQMIDLGMLAQEVALSLQLAEPERQVEFRIPDGIVAHGDANLLRIVLGNLLGNAWKYTSMREKAVIELGVRDIEGVPTYFVRDNGAGFAMMNAGQLFAPFQRLPEAKKSKGFGIGLATVERIIQRHGGKVCAEGELDKGATFYFTCSMRKSLL